MPVQTYWAVFKSGASLVSGLSPTFIKFVDSSGGATTPPSLTEAATGFYKFNYEAFGSIAFQLDGATTGLVDTDRFIEGSLDVADRLKEFVGLTSSSFGSATTDPVDIFGFLKRIQELLEGAQNYNKASGSLTFYNRGSSTSLRSFTIADSITLVTRT
jgi:hypothetical protein